jgi:Zn-dependent peptidase ImmA (M78 family)
LRLTHHRLEEIKRKAVDLLIEYSISCIPISGFEIASKMGIRVIPYSAYLSKPRTIELLNKKSEDGFFMELTDGSTTIYYNDIHRNYGRMNNTIVHEIGHYVLGHEDGYESDEMEANFFAKYILAPPPLIHKLGLKTPEGIAFFFGVSHMAACYARDYYLKWLNYGSKNFLDYELMLIDHFSGFFVNSSAHYN